MQSQHRVSYHAILMHIIINITIILLIMLNYQQTAQLSQSIHTGNNQIKHYITDQPLSRAVRRSVCTCVPSPESVSRSSDTKL